MTPGQIWMLIAAKMPQSHMDDGRRDRLRAMLRAAKAAEKKGTVNA